MLSWYSSILEVNKDPLDYIHDFYNKYKYIQAYGQMMCSMNPHKFWAKTSHDSPRPPLLKKPGRKARNRRKEVGEVGVSGHKLSKKWENYNLFIVFQYWIQ